MSDTLDHRREEREDSEEREGVVVSTWPPTDPDPEREAMKATLRAWVDRYRVNIDRGRASVTPEHIAAALPRIDWAAFLSPQDDRIDSGHRQLLDDLGAALNTAAPAADALRETLTHELLAFTWAHLATDVQTFGWSAEATASWLAADATAWLTEVVQEPDSIPWEYVSRIYIERDVLEGIWADYQDATFPAPPPYAPAFRDGVGNHSTHGVARGAMRSHIEPWQASHDGSPEFLHTWGETGVARYRIDPDAVPTNEAAWAIVKGLGDRHADVFTYVEAKWFANRDDATPGLHISASEVLDALGYAKQAAGGHKSEHVEMIADIIRDLERQTVESRFECYPPGKKKPELIAIQSKLVVVSSAAARLTLDGEARRYAWYIRPGDWALQLQHLQPQYGVALLAVLQLSSGPDYIAKRIGRYLLHNWRERYASDDLARPYMIADLLDKAGVSIDRANPKRLRTRVEAACDLLREKGVIQAWEYAANVPPPKGRWLDGWLAGGVIFTPHTAIVERKPAIQSRRRRRGAKTLPNGAAAPTT